MKANFNFEMTQAEVAAMRSLTKKVNNALGSFNVEPVELTVYDKLRIALGGRKTAGGTVEKDGVRVVWEASASKKGLSIALEIEVHESYIVEGSGIYEDAIDVYLPAITAAVGSIMASSKLFEAKADERAKRLMKAVK